MTAVEVPTAIPTPAATRRHLFRRLLRSPLALISLIFLAFVVLIAIFGPLLAPYDPNQASLQLILAPPSAEHLLGGDSAGRDVLSRLLFATRTSLLAALLAVVTALVIGVIAGLIAGYYRGWFDTVSSWFTVAGDGAAGDRRPARRPRGPRPVGVDRDAHLRRPALAGVLPAGVHVVTAVRNELYVDAARVAGLSDLRIIGRHVLSVVRAPIIIQTAIVAGIAIAIQSGLDFLGLGDPTVPDLGRDAERRVLEHLPGAARSCCGRRSRSP